MSRPVTDRIWPVLLVPVGLLCGAIAVEVYAERRGNGEIRVDIRRESAALSAGEEDGEGDPGVDLADSPPASERHEEARAAARRGQVDRAIELYRKEVENRPGEAALRFELGYWLMTSGAIEPALAELAAAENLRPNDPQLRLTIARAKRRSGDAEGAEQELRKAIELRPSFGAARLALGASLAKRGRYDDAITHLELASRTGGNAERARALVELGTALTGAKRFGEAEQKFTEAISWAPAQAELRLQIARAWLSTGKREHARWAAEILRQASELAPDLPGVFSAMGRAKEAVGETQEAKAAYERALRADPENRFARIRLLRLELDRQEHARAKSLAQQLLETGPDVPENHFLAGLVASKSGRDEEARTHYGEAIARAKGNYPEAYFNLGLLEKKSKRYDRAIEAYQKAIELRPEYLSAMNNLALTFAAAGRTADAEKTYRAALQQDPKYAAAWLNFGELLNAQKRPQEAIGAFERALAIRPEYPEAQLNLGVAYVRAGQLEDAIATYRALLEKQPRYASAAFDLGLALDSAGRAAEARAAYRRVVEIDPDHFGALEKLAELETREGDVAAARAAYEDLLERRPRDAPSRVVLAELLKKSGDLEGCAREADRALAEAPEEPKARGLKMSCVRPTNVPDGTRTGGSDE